MAPISGSLRDLQAEIQGYADEYSLQYFTQVFEIVDYEQMCEIAAYGGFPVRYPHWRFGMEYDHMIKSHTYGLSKIYELVINTDPCYAYLLEGNSFADQKLVMCHVYGHNDFFKNNRFFAPTDRRMIDVMANNASRVRRYMDRHGVVTVESFIDVCLSIDNLIDPWAPFREPPKKGKAAAAVDEEEDVHRLRNVRGYLEDYINPPDFIAKQREKAKAEKEASKRKLPARPERDVLGFLMQHAPLDAWEADVLGIIREEAYYFLPQMQTKIMNEGWASYWHSRLMTERALRDSEVIDYADACAGVMSMAPGQLNPYKIGIELFRDIERRWDMGRFGAAWEDCDDLRAKAEWDQQLGKGRDKIFEVRRLYNDVTFIDEFFTLDFAREQKFFTFQENRRSGRLEIESREFAKIKNKLLAMLTNFGQPFIYVVDANHLNRGELLLGHRHEGQDLKVDYARDTLRNLERIWRRPVSILTMIDDKPKRIRFDGSEVTISDEPAAFRV
ncbi:SpoVR family protein [Paraliomyxa miuraensis]|uniref:SpoVR family protein n=1 Tax=Paraliomyxa miuraensis TaxID=376150 RepID=UPI002257A9FB|nr:SpoVR family protein [Paraliomyxa miuraensis]MCX4242811.1 SpoVR family protein [Paraliomyxa miuraensis]